MRPQVISQTGAGTSNPIVMDYIRNPFTVSLAVDVTGTVSFSIQHSYDNPELGVANMAWRSKTALTTQIAALEDSFTGTPIRAIRIVQASGSGTTKLTVIQSGHGPGG